MAELPHEFPPQWCFHHEQLHEPMDWRDGCQDRDDVAFDGRYARFTDTWQEMEEIALARRWRWWRVRPARWLKVAAVCWWHHRTRQVSPGVYLSTGCWACTGGAVRP